MRVCTCTWPFAFGTRLGWASTRVHNPAPGSERGRAYRLRGQGAVFSRGLADLCARLRRLGLWAEDLRCVGDRWALRHLTAQPPRCPVVFVGHSCGGRYSLFAAHQLARRGVRVDLLVCLDVAGPPPVPDNVGKAVNLYLSRRRLYPARPLRPAPGSRAAIENIDLSAAGSPLRAANLNHLNITDHPAVQALTLGRILEAVA